MSAGAGAAEALPPPSTRTRTRPHLHESGSAATSGTAAAVPGAADQYSSARSTVRTRVVTAGSEGSGEPNSSARS